jgi:hypothetical protein
MKLRRTAAEGNEKTYPGYAVMIFLQPRYPVPVIILVVKRQVTKTLSPRPVEELGGQQPSSIFNPACRQAGTLHHQIML